MVKPLILYRPPDTYTYNFTFEWSPSRVIEHPAISYPNKEHMSVELYLEQRNIKRIVTKIFDFYDYFVQ